jgi:hypothetical protein
MKRSFVIPLLVSVLSLGSAFSQESSPRLDAVKKYILEKDYPEVFKGSPYKTRVEGVLDADVDNDGSREVVILFHPHYRQSAPILIYRVSPDLNVTRLAEGLAPGPLQNLSGEYLDSHNLGMAVDFEIQKEKATPQAMLQVGAENGMNGLVIYDSFFHSDGRTGNPYFIDMRGVKLPTQKHNCESFEFSRVRQIAAGHLFEDSSKNYLAAWVGDEIYVYLIRGVSDIGLLDKSLSIIKAPTGFAGFEADQGLSYKIGTKMAVLTLK